MKKGVILFHITWIALSVILFLIVACFIFGPALNRFENNTKILSEKQKIIKSDFEKIFLQKEYKILNSDDGITVELTEGNATLMCYYTPNKEFVKSEIIGAPVYINRNIAVAAWVLLAILCVVGSWATIGFFVGICTGIIEAKNNSKKSKN